MTCLWQRGTYRQLRLCLFVSGMGIMNLHVHLHTSFHPSMLPPAFRTAENQTQGTILTRSKSNNVAQAPIHEEAAAISAFFRTRRPDAGIACAAPRVSTVASPTFLLPIYDTLHPWQLRDINSHIPVELFADIAHVIE